MKLFLTVFLLLFCHCTGNAQTNGELISKLPVNLEETDIWPRISKEGQLLPEFAYLNELNFSFIVYKSDSARVKGFMIEPRDEGTYPLVIFNRDGYRDYGRLTLMTLIRFAAEIAYSGYIVMASDYRDEDAYGGQELNDVLNLIRIGKKLENVIPEKTGMLGWFRGGMMTYLALKESHEITTGIVVNGITDLAGMPGLETTVFSQIPEYQLCRDTFFRTRSVKNWPEKLCSKSSLYLICGKQDSRVNYSGTLNLTRQLDSLYYDYKLDVFDADHFFHGDKKVLNTAIITWLDERLKSLPERKVSITIDDVPNTKLYRETGKTELLRKLDSLEIPVAIFSNEEKLVIEKDTVDEKPLEDWIGKEYVTAGNHTYSHLRYSETDYTDFIKDIEKGGERSKSITGEYGKTLSYFRFPFNDLGKDSVAQIRLKQYLDSTGYKLAPYTVESADWMYDAVYEYYLRQNDTIAAERIGQLYVSETVRLFDFYDSLAVEQYGRIINQIYLCHDNRLNADFFSLLFSRLKARGYTFISLDEALSDPVYEQETFYFGKWGFSWLYRWMKSKEERTRIMRSEPAGMQILEEYNRIK